MYQKQNGCHPCGGCIPNKARLSRPASGKPAGLAAYGGLYNSGTQLVFFTAADVPVQVKLNTPMPLKNVTAVNNSLTVQTAGDYEINYNILLNTSQASTAAAAVAGTGKSLPRREVPRPWRRMTLPTSPLTGVCRQVLLFLYLRAMYWIWCSLL